MSTAARYRSVIAAPPGARMSNLMLNIRRA
jgi:hypothetical protein